MQIRISFWLAYASPWILFFTAWQLAAELIGIPAPSQVLMDAPSALSSAGILKAFGSTVGRSLFVFVVSAVGGALLAVLPGTADAARKGFEGLVDFLRSIPVPVLLPVFMGLLGLYQGPKVALAIFGCILVNIVYLSYGIRREMKSLRVRLAKGFGGSTWFVFSRVIFPATIEDLVAGLRVTLSLALVLSTLAELFLMTGIGAGVEIRLAYEDRDTVRMYTLIMLLGVVGVLLNRGFLLAERSVMGYRYGLGAGGWRKQEDQSSSA